MTEKPAPRAAQATRSANDPTGGPESRPARADAPEGRTQARECKRGDGRPISVRRVVLVGPDGTDRKRCGPYCDSCTDVLLKNLTPTYTGGGAAYRIDREEPDSA